VYKLLTYLLEDCAPYKLKYWCADIHRGESEGVVWGSQCTRRLFCNYTTVSQKTCYSILTIISSNLNRFSKFFHCCNVC